MAYEVFISYRRGEHLTITQWLHACLSKEIPDDEIFLDKDEMVPGSPFPLQIEAALQSAKVFVILVGKAWLGVNPADPTGPRRIDNPLDFVRKEVTAALANVALDVKKFVLPVMCQGTKMPKTDALPDSLKDLHKLHYLEIDPKRQGEGVIEIVNWIVERIDVAGKTPEEERWILHHITTLLQGIGRREVIAIGQDLARVFPDVGVPPDSARSLAKAIYQRGPSAFQFLLRLQQPRADFRRLLHLLATYWINAEEVAALRGLMSPAPAGRKIAIQCNFTDFTPKGSLLKASRNQFGWPQVEVKPSDTPAEIVAQIQTTLLEVRPSDSSAKMVGQIQTVLRQELGKLIRLPATANPDPRSMEERERERINHILHQRIETERQGLPVVLHLDHHMALDGALIAAVQSAFPSLHLLIATPNPNELAKVVRIIRPAGWDAEEAAYDDYAEAEHNLDRLERGLL